MRRFTIPEERKSREVSDVVSLRCLLVAHSKTQICVASENLEEEKIPDKGDSVVRHILTNSLKDSEDSVAGLAVLPV